MSVQLRAETAKAPSAGKALVKPALRVTVHRDLAAVEASWRSFERTAVATPYQRFDWARAYAETLGRAQGERPLIATAENDRGLVMLLPLTVKRRGGLSIATFIGGQQANFLMPMFEPAAVASLDAAAWRSLFHDIARAAGIDVFSLFNQPLGWQGVPNPLVKLGGSPSPNPGFRRQLDFSADAALGALLSTESRKKLRKKERRLHEMGAVAYRRVEDPAEAERVLAAFLDQKATRFRHKHINNPFADPAAVEFLRRGSRPEGGEPAIELYGLFAGDAIVATFGGTCDGRRFCGMFNSFSMDQTIAKSSPGELLLLKIIEDQCRRGVQTFDLGVGEAPYKLAICNETEPLVDIYLPVSLGGRLYAALDHMGRAAKGWAKSTPWVVALVARYRRRSA
jgi:CelD/BcsL family acetyltransferase involved in cellulose biosynthesis